nr:MAG TPA: hypothetical protein [Caudoviricetes sp.]
MLMPSVPKKRTLLSKSSSSPQVIPLGFEPKTHSLEDYPSKIILSSER